jgi:hypothetical protein
MAKRRTRKQKERAKHRFTLLVKGQFQNATKPKKTKAAQPKKAKFLAKQGDLASIKREIFKSLILASLILGLELMIYLAWYV